MRLYASLVLLALGIINMACAAFSSTPPRATAIPGQATATTPAIAVRGLRKDGPVRPDTSKALVPIEEIISGGPPPDGIPPIDEPKFVSIADADGWLKDREPVIALDVDGEARAYPLQIMTWHEIVNDELGGIPVIVTFCPLCNTALAFDRRLKGIIYDFGTSGMLYKSDLVMYDRQTHSYWSQALGRAIVGELTGEELIPIPAQIVAWGDFKRAYPQAKALSRDTGYSRDYGRNPYVGYDDINETPFLYRGTIDGRLAAMERVVLVKLAGEIKAYPFTELGKARVVMDRVGGQDIVIFYAPGTASALDGPRIPESRDVGAAAVFSPVLNGRSLTFEPVGQGFKDLATGSHWNLLGQAIDGPLKGQKLTPVVHGNHFWFASAAFYPQVQVWPAR